jgi:uncharacterized membrane protein YphA (DoxX/SURF4 family)
MSVLPGREVAEWLATVARLVLGVVWVVAGAVKLPDPAEAVRAVRAYRLLPEGLVAPVAFGLPAVEIAVGLALLCGVAVRAAAGCAAVLLTVFSAALISAWVRGLTIDCGCFGSGGEVGAGRTAYASELLRDAALLAVALALARWPNTRLAIVDRARRPSRHVHSDDADGPVTGDPAAHH